MRTVHRVMFSSLFVIGLVWGLGFALSLAPGMDTIESIGISIALGAFGLTSAAFWPAGYVLICDYIHSRLDKNGAFYLKYAESLQKDLVISVIGAILLFLVYWLDSADYSSSGIDIAFIGVPLLIGAFYSLIQCCRLKPFGNPVAKVVFLKKTLPAVMYFGVAIGLLIKNSSGELSFPQALFLQISIVLGGLQSYLGCSLIQYSLTKEEVHPSPFIEYFYESVIPSQSGITKKVAVDVRLTNQRWKQRKSERSAEIRHSQKSSKKNKKNNSRDRK
ncbi:hypothetical protein [Pseudomonas sp. BN102]|uniref:hypothetical protein n=1 Tax=Pseudomonas sp. BN102 TaxID=2567886 RepID=UPI002453833D|nr:hypothetical protein [Pseudomonas sp. BN102]MDH4610321.1 hypothetical protein [Pseudomonas sp. BN102]